MRQDTTQEPTPEELAPPPVAEESHGMWLDDYFERVFGGSSLHPLVQAFLVVVFAALFAKLLDWVVTRILQRLAAGTKLRVDDQIVQMMHGPLTRSVVVVGLAVATHPLAIAPPWGHHVRDLLYTVAILIWVPFVYRASTLLLRAASEDEAHFKTLEPRTFPLFNNLAKLLFFGGFIYLIFIQVWGVDPAGFLASAGIVGLAVGFAAQDTLSNLFAGVFIIADAPYRVGDYITLDTGERGEVLHIGLRSTRILTRDDIEVTVPNAVMGAAKITNEAGGPSTSHRIRVPVSVAYGSDIDLVQEVLMAAANSNSNVVKRPEPRVRFRTFGESGLDFELLCWIPVPVLRGATLHQLNSTVYKAFAEKGIEIPYPKRDVYVHHVAPDGGEGA
jgi:small-conductance mechanosensitive channel